MTWVNLSSAFSYGSKLTSTQMQNLRDNIAAAFAKDSGAPVLANNYIATAMINDAQVTEAKLGAAAVDRTAMKTSGDTGTNVVSGTITDGSIVAVEMQDYCFFPKTYRSDTGVYFLLSTDVDAETIGFFDILNSGGDSRNYAVYWRYVTATDRPFVFVLRNDLTGDVQHLWMCEDPPSNYWGMGSKPADFKAPVRIKNDPTPLTEIVLFDQPKAFLKEIMGKAKGDKKLPHETMNDYEYNDSRKLFVKKNISMI